jgi:general secretion pathway protein K
MKRQRLIKPVTPSRRRPLKQQGVALITVLLVFALAAIITSQVASRNYRDIRKTANLINSKQAYHYALAGEQFARQLLFRDFDDSELPRSDRLSDNWANIDRVFDIDNGSMTIVITDQQGKFNLNNLLQDNGQVNTLAYSQFQGLLDELDIDRQLAVVLLDWLDSNSVAFKNGAEDPQYEELQYLTANQPLSDRSELRLLQQMAFEDYSRLKDYVVALPKTVNEQAVGITKYNLNTLDAKLIEVLSVGSANAERIVSRQQQGGYSTVSQWFSNGEANALQAVQNQLSADSVFFELLITAVYDDRVSIIRSQLYRDPQDGKITLIKRQQGIE